MAIYKRCKTYHVDVAVNGVRYRESLETGNWQEAQRKKKELINRIMEGKAGAPAGKGSFASLPLAQALTEFITGRVAVVVIEDFMRMLVNTPGNPVQPACNWLLPSSF